MSKLGIGVQLYTVRDLAAKDFPGTVKKVAELGYRYVELAGYGNLKTAQEVKKALDDAGLKAPSGHWAIDILRKESELQRVMDECSCSGCSTWSCRSCRKICERTPTPGSTPRNS